MTTDKTIKSKYQPEQTNVTWVDLSGKTPVEKHFINGRWQAIGGGGSGAGSSNSDYTVTRSLVTLDNESVTTTKNDEGDPASFGNFTNTIKLEEGSTYIVVFDGVEYQCVAKNDQDVGGVIIGATFSLPVDFSEYPFIIAYNYFDGESYTKIATENPGTYQVEIKGQGIDSITVSDDFSAAVEYVSKTFSSLKLATVVLNTDNDWTDGFKIYFQKECIYDTTELRISPNYFFDNETGSMRVDSGNRRSIPEKMFNIDALLIPNLHSNIILYKNIHTKNDGSSNSIQFSSVFQIKKGNTLITGSNCINIYASYAS